MTQAQLAELYQVGVPTVNEHIHNLFAEGEVMPEATIRKFRTLRTEGNRSVSRTLEHYSLPVVVAVGYRVRSPRGTQFRRWATTRLEEYIVKGFTMDDQRLKQPGGVAGGPDYFDELLQRIRDIRSSEKVFYRKVLAIFATSIDYDPRAEDCGRFFALVQNKMHWAAHGHTAAEVIAERADASKPNMGLTSFAGERPRKVDVSVAKNYLRDDEIDTLNRIVSAYLEFAELQASHRRPMHMADWAKKLDDFIALGDRAVLDPAAHPSAISHDEANEKARSELARYTAEQARLASAIDADFDEAVKQTMAIAKERETSS
ncbi:MAG TPA: virulence RhuM family protein [Kofleriaceae bacterium]